MNRITESMGLTWPERAIRAVMSFIRIVCGAVTCVPDEIVKLIGTMPTSVGTPERTPFALRPNPAGNSSGVQVKLPVPPDAWRANEKGCATPANGKTAVVNTMGAVPATVNENARAAVTPPTEA